MSEEDNEILKRFSKVFEQAYIRFMDLRKSCSDLPKSLSKPIPRFLDIEKAEEQAWEAQIEAALEKVRSPFSGHAKT